MNRKKSQGSMEMTVVMLITIIVILIISTVLYIASLNHSIMKPCYISSQTFCKDFSLSENGKKAGIAIINNHGYTMKDFYIVLYGSIYVIDRAYDQSGNEIPVSYKEIDGINVGYIDSFPNGAQYTFEFEKVSDVEKEGGIVEVTYTSSVSGLTFSEKGEFDARVQQSEANDPKVEVKDTSFNLKSDYACNDSIDNDGDGYIDLIDIGCDSATDITEDTADGCRYDFSLIDGNIVSNPYFECNATGYTNRPANWSWSVANPSNHKKLWYDDQTIPDISHKAVAWYPTSFPFTHDDRKDGISQFNQTPFETGRWYEYECMFKADNVLPIFNSSGDLNDSLYASYSEIGCELRIYHPDASGGYDDRKIGVSGPKGGDWDETYGLHTNWLPGDTGGWITQRVYVFIPTGTEKVFFHLINYGLANLSVARVRFMPTDCNCDPRIPKFKKSGNLSFVNFSGQDMFGIAFWGPPHRNGQTVSYQEMEDSGINTMIKLYGYHQGISSWYWNMNMTNLSEHGIYGILTTYGGFRSSSKPIFNKTSVPTTYQGRATSLNTYLDYPNFVGIYDDEPECHTMGFLPGLEEWKWYKERWLRDEFVERGRQGYGYINYCGSRGGYTSHDNDQVEPLMNLSDIFSYTENFLDYGNDSLAHVQLQETGAMLRYRLERATAAQEKTAIAWAMVSAWYGYATRYWKNDDQTIKRELIRFQLYNQVVNGATGVNWFGMLDTNLVNSAQLDFYKKINSTNQELNKLMPVLTEQNYYDLWNSDKYLEAMLKLHEEKAYLIATNPSYTFSGDVRIELDSSLHVDSVIALFENNSAGYNIDSNRTIALDGNNITDSFEEFGVHIYEVTLSEVCDDGLDNDGDETVDEDCPNLHEDQINSIIPHPQITLPESGSAEIDNTWKIIANLSDAFDNFTANYVWNQSYTNSSGNINLAIYDISNTELTAKSIIIGNPKFASSMDPLLDARSIDLHSNITEGFNQGYVLSIDQDYILIAANSTAGTFYGAVTLTWLLNYSASKIYIPKAKIFDWPNLRVRGYYGDIYTSTTEEWIDYLARYKMNLFTGSLPWNTPPMTQGKINTLRNRERYLRNRHFYTTATLNPQYTANYDPNLYEGFFARNVTIRFGEDNIARPNRSAIIEGLNGDFEIDLDSDGIPDGWTKTSANGGSWSRDCTTSASGSCSMRLNLSAFLPGIDSSGYIRTISKYNLTPNAIYQLSAWAKKSPFSSAGQTQVTASILNASEKDMYASSVVFENNNGTWKKYNVTFSTNNNESKFTIYSRAQSTPALDLWIDNITIEEISSELINVMENEYTKPEIYSADRSIMYQRDIDYTITYSGTLNAENPMAGRQMIITRIPSGNIPAQATVVVDYDFLPRMQWARTEYHTFSDPTLFDVYDEYFLEPMFTALNPDYIFLGSPDELRGFNRDSRSLWDPKPNYIVLAEFLNAIYDQIKSHNESTQVITWDDMENPFHNGGNENYQLLYGGKKGKTWYSLDMLPRDFGQMPWWYDANDYAHVISGSPVLYSKLGFSYFVCPWDNDVNIRWWAKQAYENDADGLIDQEYYDRYGGIPSSANYSWNAPDEAGCDPEYLEICDGIDNDCDAIFPISSYTNRTASSPIDEGFYLNNDSFNCGSCGNICYYPKAFSSCLQGTCNFTGCYDDYYDADNDSSDGCECQLTNDAIELQDRVDNDCDGLVDESTCNDSIDNDGDGYADMDDIDCSIGGNSSSNLGYNSSGIEFGTTGLQSCNPNPDPKNLINNSRFECDMDRNGEPDGWEPKGVDANHSVLWLNSTYDTNGKFIYTNSSSHYPSGHGLWRYESPIYSPMEPNTWYEFSASIASRNIEPDLNSNGEITDDYSVMGIRIQVKNTSNGWIPTYPTISPFGVNLTQWDDDAWIFRTFNKSGFSGWRNVTIYFLTPNSTGFFELFSVNYIKGEIFIDNVKIKKVNYDGANLDPTSVFKRSGNISLIEYDINKDEMNESYFPIILAGKPKNASGDYVSDYSIFGNAGFNMVSTSAVESQTSQALDNNISIQLGIDTLQGPYAKWRNDPASNLDYTGKSINTNRIDYMTSIQTQTLIMYNLFDETGSHPSRDGMFIPDLRPYKAVSEYIRQQNPNALIYSNQYGIYTGDYKDLATYYSGYTDLISFTCNTPRAYPKNDRNIELTECGKRVRRILNEYGLSNENKNKKAIGFALGAYGWSDWDGTGQWHWSEYIPFNLQRYQIYDQIINGASGMLFYGNHYTNLGIARDRHFWNQVTNLSKELSSINQILIEPEFYDEWNTSDERINIMMKKIDGKVYLIAVSTYYQNISNVEISLPNYKIRSVVALHERISDGMNYMDLNYNRSIDINPLGDSFNDSFAQLRLYGLDVDDPDAPGYAVHIYEVELSVGDDSCNDSIDNDGDGYADMDDIDCSIGGNSSSNLAYNSSGIEFGTTGLQSCNPDPDPFNLVANARLECSLDSLNPLNWSRSGNDTNHTLAWIADPKNEGHSKVLKTEFNGNGTPSWFMWYQKIYDLKPDTWYQFSASFASEGYEPFMTQQNKIGSDSYSFGASVDFSGFQYVGSTVFTTGTNFTEFNDVYWVYKNYSLKNEPWRQVSIYFKTPISFDETSVYLRTYNYPKAIGYFDNFTLKESSDPVEKERSGTLQFMKYQGNDFFPIALQGWPSRPGNPGRAKISFEEVKSAGFNAIDVSDQDPQLFIDNDMAAIFSLPGSSLYQWQKGRTDFTNLYTQERKNLMDDYAGFANLLFFVGTDEVTSAMARDGTGIQDSLEPYQVTGDFLKNVNPDAKILYNFGGLEYPYTGVHEDLAYYYPLADYVSYTGNLPSAYPTTKYLVMLPKQGRLISRGIIDSKARGDYKPHIASGFPVHEWAWWDGTTSHLNRFIPFNLQRFQAWDQIINGAVGIWWQDTSLNYLEDTYDAAHYDQIVSISKEFASLYDVLIEPNFYSNYTISDDGIEIMMKKHNGTVYLFTASTHYEDMYGIQINLTGGFSIKTVKALHENDDGSFNSLDNRTLLSGNNGFTDDFIGFSQVNHSTSNQTLVQTPGYAVHIYEITLSEICDDDIDNDIDGSIDELDCIQQTIVPPDTGDDNDGGSGGGGGGSLGLKPKNDSNLSKQATSLSNLSQNSSPSSEDSPENLAPLDQVPTNDIPYSQEASSPNSFVTSFLLKYSYISMLIAAVSALLIAAGIFTFKRSIHKHLVKKYAEIHVSKGLPAEKLIAERRMTKEEMDNLIRYLENCLLWHYPKKSIIKACEAVGWDKKVVEAAIKDIKKK